MTPQDISQLGTKEAHRLRRIGSDKDPLLFHTQRSIAPGEGTKNRSIIINWADDQNQHGCRFSCKFCSWKEHARRIGRIVPSPNAIADFLQGFSGYKVTLSGGGDPLYNLKDNLDELMQIVETIHELGCLVEVVTKEISVVASTHNTLLREIDMWSFSTESRNPCVRDTIQQVDLSRLSKVIVPGDPGNQHLPEYIQYYLDSDNGPYQILLREDYFGRPTPADIPFINEAIQLGQGRVRFLPNALCADNLFLINDKIHTGQTEFMGGHDAIDATRREQTLSAATASA